MEDSVVFELHREGSVVVLTQVGFLQAEDIAVAEETVHMAELALSSCRAFVVMCMLR